jgi:hypothetical protein
MTTLNVDMIAFVMCVAFLVSLPFALKYYNQKPEHTATFSQGMCYIENGIREPWRPNPDGIIVMKGYKKYLVLPRIEADRVSGGDKIGAEEDIETFDAKYHEAICPKNWLRHAHTKH